MALREGSAINDGAEVLESDEVLECVVEVDGIIFWFVFKSYHLLDVACSAERFYGKSQK